MLTTTLAMLLLGVGEPNQDPIGSAAVGKGGAIAAGAAPSVAIGLRRLREGGNAADAAAATILALAITDYGLFAMGGEAALLIYDAKSEQVYSLSGIGRAPTDPQAITWYYENGIPAQGSMKAAPVPGAFDMVITLLRRFGTIGFQQAVAPTIELLDGGSEPWHPHLAATLRRLVAAEAQATGSREDRLAAVADYFYRGDLAQQLEQWYIAQGSFLRRADLAAHTTKIEAPVTIDYKGYQIYKCGPWTQGPALCQALGLLAGYPLKDFGHLSPDYIHTVTEALKLALADRDDYYADPLLADVPIDRLFSPEYQATRRTLIDPQHASQERRPGDPFSLLPLRSAAAGTNRSGRRIPVQDTTTCVVADRFGNVVAATPSCNLLSNRPGPQGITQGNRLRCLNTSPNHPNCLQPGKRPRITLTPTLVLKNGRPVVAISVAGGDLQDQTSLNVLLNHIEFGLPPEQAVTVGRFATNHHLNSFDPQPDREAAMVQSGSLVVSEDIPETVRSELAKRGHKISTSSAPIGHPVMLSIDPDTHMVHAAGDPRAGRHAAAIP